MKFWFIKISLEAMVFILFCFNSITSRSLKEISTFFLMLRGIPLRAWILRAWINDSFHLSTYSLGISFIIEESCFSDIFIIVLQKSKRCNKLRLCSLLNYFWKTATITICCLSEQSLALSLLLPQTFLPIFACFVDISGFYYYVLFLLCYICAACLELCAKY